MLTSVTTSETAKKPYIMTCPKAKLDQKDKLKCKVRPHQEVPGSHGVKVRPQEVHPLAAFWRSGLRIFPERCLMGLAVSRENPYFPYTTQTTLLSVDVRPSYDNKSAKGEPAWACGVSRGPKHGRRFAYVPDVSAVEGSWRKGRPYDPKPLGPCDRRT
ncbi:hypothetical protein AOLI_G00237900 [Acnodon oligacanthus]